MCQASSYQQIECSLIDPVVAGGWYVRKFELVAGLMNDRQKKPPANESPVSFFYILKNHQ